MYARIRVERPLVNQLRILDRCLGESVRPYGRPGWARRYHPLRVPLPIRPDGPDPKDPRGTGGYHLVPGIQYATDPAGTLRRVMITLDSILKGKHALALLLDTLLRKLLSVRWVHGPLGRGGTPPVPRGSFGSGPPVWADSGTRRAVAGLAGRE